MKYKIYFKKWLILVQQKWNSIYEKLRISRHKFNVAFLIPQVANSCQQ
jgi:hypothetical protein